MARIRTHNRRAKRPPYAVFARKRHMARKILRYGAMYGMGVQKLGEYAKLYGTVTGRMVSPGPPPQYTLPKSGPRVDQVFHTNFAEMEARALIIHKQMLDEARERGDIVIEHTYADATILPKEKQHGTR